MDSPQAANPKKMRGIGFEVEEMMKLFLVIIVGIAVVILITATSGGISGILTEFCAKNPTICGEPEQRSLENYMSAKESVGSLACAINSVALERDTCNTASTSSLSPAQNYGVTGFALNDIDTSPTVKCERNAVDKKTSYVCTVSNFKLPQRVSEQWIWTYGDPQFLTYWQVFPMSQDTWSFKADWKIFAAIAVVSAIPPTRVAGAMTKVGFKAVAEKLAAREAEKMLAEEVVKIAGRRFLEKPVTVLVKGAALSGGALALQFASSTRAKYQPEKNSIVMKSPYEDKDVFSLQDVLEGKPVLVHWEPGAITKYTDSAHFVSPCSIESMDVEKTVAECEEYVFNADTGIVGCSNPKTNEDSSLPPCNIYSYMDYIETGGGSSGGWNMDKISQMSTNDVASVIFGSKWEDYKNNKLLDCSQIDNEINSADAIVKGYVWTVRHGVLMEPGGGSYYVAACNESGVSAIHKLVVTDKKAFDWGYSKGEILLDSDRDDHFDSYTLKNCQIDAILITNIKETQKKFGEYNYCQDETGNTAKILKTLGLVLGIPVTIGAGFISGPAGWFVLIAGSAATAASGAGGEYMDYMGKWPGSKG